MFPYLLKTFFKMSSSSPKSGSTDSQMSIGLILWVAFCLLICLWLVKVFYRGRYQFQRNLHVIEDGLKKMQDEMDLRRRQKSIGCIENIEDITAFLEELQKPQKEEVKLLFNVEYD